MDVLNLIVQLGGGAAGGNFAGSLSDRLNLGLVGNTLTGMIGGGLGMAAVNGTLGLAGAIAATHGPDMGALAAQLAASTAGGGALAFLTALLTGCHRGRASGGGAAADLSRKDRPPAR